MNKILKRQIKRKFSKDFDITTLDIKVQELLQSISDTYDEFDKEKRLLENTLDLNSTELYAANRQIEQKNKKLNTLLDDTTEENKKIGIQLQQYKYAMDSALLVINFDLDENITSVNKNICELTQMSQSEFIGKKHLSIYYKNNHQNEITDTIVKQNTWKGQLQYKSQNGDIYTLNSAIFPIVDAYNHTMSYISIFQDITEIEKSRQKALELDKAKSLFIANMSHELRTPLNSIIGFSQILRRQKKIKPKLQNYIQKINYSGEHLLKLINSILDFSKIEAGQIKLENIDINLKKIIRETIIQFETEAKQKNISLLFTYDSQMNEHFLGDSLRLTQILTNLVSNAIKFTNNGSVTIAVKSVRENRVRIEVQDTGIGLTKVEAKKLFKEFSQADSSTTREYGGTGLGLSISKELIQLMNGTIWIESHKGKGSNFIFEIDLQKNDIGTDKENSKKLFDDDLSIERVNALQEKNILLVEDNKTNQLLITSMLEDSNIKIDIANHGLEALNLINARKTQYDLIFMDLQMPIMNGFETSIEIRKNDKKVPIIALSANIIQEDIEKSKHLGMQEHLAKPIEILKFYSCLLRYLG